ncbi:hypothetical protein HDU77_006009 [Chytriomyces hyalinus]|nr:hypothetical protein HDU77_006009 [Chytriomyces hyalinus]
MNLCHLPNEVTIASHLPLEDLASLTSVSHALKRISLDAFLWRAIFINPSFIETETYAVQLGERGKSFLRGRNQLSTVMGILMGTVVPNVGCAIRSVDFKGLGDNFQDVHLVQIARWCPNLVSCNVSGTSVTEKGAEYLFGRVNRHSQVVQVLRDGVSKSRTPSNQPGPAPSSGSPKAAPPPPQPEAYVADVFVQEYLVNESCRENEHELRERQIVDTITRSLSLLLPSARQMNLSDTSTNITIPDEALNAFIPRCPHLERVYLNLARPIGDATISKLARSSKFLKLLDLSSYTSTSQVGDDGVRIVVEMCPGIEVLLLEGASRLTDDALMSLGGWKKTGVLSRNMKEMWEMMSGFESRLRILKLTGCFQVTDFGVRSVLSGCADLKVLSLGYCWRVSDAAFSQGEGDLLVNPKLGFWNSAGKIPIACRGLKELSVRFCYLVTNLAVSTLDASCLGQLERVDVTSCPRVLLDDRNRHVLYIEEEE